MLASVAAAAAGVLVLAAAPRVADLPAIRDGQRDQAELAADLERAVRLAGGERGLARCGRPYVGHLRGPLLAYRLGVEKREVAFAPRTPGVVFRSRLTASAAPAPAVPAGFHERARAGRWRVLATCGTAAEY